MDSRAAGGTLDGTWLSGLDPAILLAGMVLAGVLAVLSVALVFTVRRLRRREIRELVGAVEDLRAGRSRKLEIDSRSPYAGLAESLHRLSQDLSLRWIEAEGALELASGIAESLHDRAVVTTDADGDIRTVGGAASALFGWDVESLRGRTVASLFREESWKDLLPRMARRDLRERGIECEASVVRRDGTPVAARVAVRALRRPGNERGGFLFLVRDATVEAKLESELRASEGKYRRLVEGLAEGVAVLERGRIAYANPALAAMLESRAEDLAGTRFTDRVAASDVLVVRETLESAERGEARRPRIVRATLLGARGEPSLVVRIAATSAEGPGSALVSLFDESAERRAEAVLRRNETRLDAVLEAASDGLALLTEGPAGAVVSMANANFARLTGLRLPSVLGANEGDLLRALRERGEGRDRLAALLAGPAREARRGTIETGGSPPRVLEVAVLPLSDGQGGVSGRLVAIQDTSERIAAERRLKENAERLRKGKEEIEVAYRELGRLHEDVKSRSEEVERLNAELRTLVRMKSELLANVSHELQTPLVAIRGYTEMILKERLGRITEEQKKGLTLSLRNVDRLISLIDDLLAFARADREEEGVRPKDFPLKPLIDEAIALFEERLRAERIEVSATIEPGDLAVRADRDKILQVFVNLLSNASKFNREGGEIRVEARRGRPRFVEVLVRDTGVGIPEEDLERIFDRFYRSEAEASEARDGTGIGLAIVRRILRLHGCAIHATSRKGEGTTFTFTLPLAEETASRAPEPESAPDPPRPAGNSPPTAPPPMGSAPSGRPRLKIIRR